MPKTLNPNDKSKNGGATNSVSPTTIFKNSGVEALRLERVKRQPYTITKGEA